MNRSCQVALNAALSLVDGKAPERIELIPAGPEVRGRDGRRFLFDDIAGRDVLGAFREGAIKLPLDWEHATQHRAPRGEEAPAAAWITSLSIEGGALWGDVAWTARGAAQVEAHEYCFHSPVFDFDPTTGRIVRLVSAGLTNKPNLHLQALNQEHPMSRSTALVAAITGALGLAADAADDAVAVAINQIKADGVAATARAANAEQAAPALERYVPRADYDAVVARANNAEQKLRDSQAAALKEQAEGEIDAALKAGRIAPASVDHYRALCADASGMAAFRELVKTLPVIGQDTDLGTRKPSSAETSLNAEQAEAARLLGMTPEQYRAALA